MFHQQLAVCVCSAGRSRRRRNSSLNSVTGWNGRTTANTGAWVAGQLMGGSPPRRDVDAAAGAIRVGGLESGRLPRDDYVRLDSNDCSVAPWVIGRGVIARGGDVADLHPVTVRCAETVVAANDRC